MGAELIEIAERLKARLPKVKKFISLEISADGMLFTGKTKTLAEQANSGGCTFFSTRAS